VTDETRDKVEGRIEYARRKQKKKGGMKKTGGKMEE